MTIDFGIFAKLPDVEWMALRKIVKIVMIPMDELIVVRGRKDREFYMLFEGRAQVVRRHRSGKELVVRQLVKGDLIGELSFVAGAPRSADVRAQTSCKLIAMRWRDFNRVRHATPEFIFRMLELVASRLAYTTQQLAQATLLDLPSRLLLLLNEFSRSAVTAGKSGSPVFFDVPSQSDLARNLGVARESINRSLRELEESGEIKREGGRVRICPRSNT